MGIADELERLRREDPQAYERARARTVVPAEVYPEDFASALRKVVQEQADLAYQDRPGPSIAQKVRDLLWAFRRTPAPRPTLRAQRVRAIARARRLGRAR